MNQQLCTNSLRLFATVVVAVYSTAALAQVANEGKARNAAARQMAHDAARAYTFSLTNGRKAELSLLARPVQYWTNDVNGEFHGSVFLWTLDGRPQVVGSLYRSYTPYSYFAVELQSLCEQKLSAAKDGKVVWQPPAGVTFRSLAGGEPPTAAAVGRNRQMKSLARRFVGELTDLEKVKRQLQVLPQPLYRYENTPPNLLDGAIFSLGDGTDPEVLLLLEARRTAGEFQWQYALARLSIMQLHVSYDGQTVWSADSVTSPYEKPREPYTIIQRDMDASQ